MVLSFKYIVGTVLLQGRTVKATLTSWKIFWLWRTDETGFDAFWEQ